MLIRMGALIGMGSLIKRNTFKGGPYLKWDAYWKEETKSNHYSMLLSL